MPDSKSGATAMYPASATSSASSCTQSVMPKISWITSTTGVLLFDSGYTTNISTERPSCFTVTHSRWRGDFSRVARAQSRAETNCAAQSTNKEIKVMRFMVWFLPQRDRWPDTNWKTPVQNDWHCNAMRKSPQDREECFHFSACVATHACFRYVFEFTQLALLLLGGSDKLPHGRRKASYPRTRFFRVVQPTGPQGAACRLRAGARLHDRAALWLGAVGKHPTGARPPVQGHRPSKRGVPDAHSTQLHRQGKAPRGRVFAGACGCHHRRRRRTRRTPGHSPHVGNDHRPHVVEVDSVLSRLAGVDEPVEQRGALGIADQAFSANAGILLAGGPHGSRDARRGGSGNAPDAGYLCRFCDKRRGDSGDPREKIRCRKIRRRGRHLFDRSDDGRRQGAAIRHFSFSGTEFRPSLRGQVP